MNNFLERISKIADNESITITRLEQKIGASKGVLTKAINKGTDIQSKWLLSLAENYPLYSTRWILLGEGKMLREYNDQQQEMKEKIKKLEERLAEKDEYIKELKEDKEALREAINTLNNTKKEDYNSPSAGCTNAR